MPEVIGIFDGGSAVIKLKNGAPVHVGAIIFRTSENESKPIDHVGYCRLSYQESIIKNLKRIMWAKPEPEPVVIPAQAGIQEGNK